MDHASHTASERRLCIQSSVKRVSEVAATKQLDRPSSAAHRSTLPSLRPTAQPTLTRTPPSVLSNWAQQTQNARAGLTSQKTLLAMSNPFDDILAPQPQKARTSNDPFGDSEPDLLGIGSSSQGPSAASGRSTANKPGYALDPFFDELVHRIDQYVDTQRR